MRTLLFITFLCLVGRAHTAELQESYSFARDIRPILASKCMTCHGPDSEHRKGKYRVDDQNSFFKGGSSGNKAIVPGDSESSELIRRIFHQDPDEQMPPPDSKFELTETEKNILKYWVNQGAAWEGHWAFIQPQKSPIPQSFKNLTVIPRNPIDNFTFAKLESNNWHPQAEAEKSDLIRRVTFDILGLPPTWNEVKEFMEDDSDEAYEKVVDRLLRTEHFGEHMTRFWLDAARYGDTHGLHLDNYREMWPYRDWLINSFNSNLPYSDFITYQLAGDLLPSPSLEQKIATGFNRCHVTTGEGGSITEEVRMRNIVERVVATGTVFLGLTLDCTRCHDHKFDPLTMKDFYSFSAFFNNIDGHPMDGNKKDHAPFIKVPTDPQSERLIQLKQSHQKHKSDLDALEKLFTEAKSKWMIEESNDIQKTPENIQTIFNKNLKDRSKEEVKALDEYFLNTVFAQGEELKSRRQKESAARKAMNDYDRSIPITLVWKEKKDEVPAYILKRGEYSDRGEQVFRDVPGILPGLGSLPKNRLGLAQWMTRPDNPLVARVAVNRLWQQFFGTGLVKTSEDFGIQGEFPSHPLLLDWLSVDFQENDWNFKRLIKMIVMSHTYRQSSKVRQTHHSLDPNNRLFHRGPRYRLDAEMIRDQALFTANMMNLKIGGPPVKPPQPLGLWKAVGYSGSNTVNFKADEDPEKTHRRSIYTFYKRTSPPPQLTTFDAPSREACVMRRERTNTPMQALLLMNDPQFVEPAVGLAFEAVKLDRNDEETCDWIFKQCFLREPTNQEHLVLISAFNKHFKIFASRPESAHEFMQVGIFKSLKPENPERLASYAMLANLLFNTDEYLNKN